MDDLKAFYSPLSKAEREDFARRCGSTSGVIQNVMYGVRPCSRDLALALELQSKGRVSVEHMRPDEKWVRVPDEQWPHPDGRPLLDLAPAETPAPTSSPAAGASGADAVAAGGT